jgi:methylthioribose-1-phosphate isomerase
MGGRRVYLPGRRSRSYSVLRVNGQSYRTVWWDGDGVCFIDQNFLPFSFHIFRAAGWEICCDAIRTMQVRGAGAIGALAGYAMALAFRQAPEQGFADYVGHARAMIESTRPTARNLYHATERVFTAGMISRGNAIMEAEKVAGRDAEDSRKMTEHRS